MKKILIVLLFVFSFITFDEGQALKPDLTLPKYADFRVAYTRIRKWEGNWGFLKHDAGMETYGGVTRAFNPEWIGWSRVDNYKRSHVVTWNTHIPEAEFWVQDYYLDLWVREGFNNIRDQTFANYLFDFRVNTNRTKARSVMKTIFANIAPEIQVPDTEMWVTKDFNNVRPLYLLVNLRSQRIIFYNDIVHRNHTQAIFLQGWLNRTEDIWG